MVHWACMAYDMALNPLYCDASGDQQVDVMFGQRQVGCTVSWQVQEVEGTDRQVGTAQFVQVELYSAEYLARQFPIASSGLLHSSSATQIAPYAAGQKTSEPNI